VSKARSIYSNTRDPAFLAEWQPWRYSIRPPECDMGSACWVTQPYDALAPSAAPSCLGCGGSLGIPTNRMLLREPI